MKKLKIILPAFILTMLLISCNKEDRNENRCPIVSSQNVPTAVTDAFDRDNTPSAVKAWFKKDNNTYCVIFLDQNGVETKIYYSANGDVISTEVENDNENVNEEHEDNDSGCECDLDEENDED